MRAPSNNLKNRSLGGAAEGQAFPLLDKESAGGAEYSAVEIMDRHTSSRSRWQRARRLGCSIVVIVAFFFIIPVHVLSFYSKNASMATPDDFFHLLVEEQKEQEPHTTSTTSSTSSFSFSGFNICPIAMHLITDNKETVQSSFKELYTFHNMGGNLMTLDKYLNKQINPTLHKLGITFNTNAAATKEERTNTSSIDIDAAIHQELRKNDRKNRGGYDQRALPGKFEPSKHPFFHCPHNERMDVIEPITEFQRFTAAVGPVSDICKEMNTIGGISYERKYMCSFDYLKDIKKARLEQQRPIANDNDNADGKIKISTNTTTSNERCDMISIGSNNQWGFEKTITEMTDCQVHSFDCTVNKNSKGPNDSVHFHPFCISAEYKQINGREYLPYSQILERANLTNAPALLKMDVEGFEFDVLLNMVNDARETGMMHMLPLQISTEIHYATRMYDLPWMMRFRQAGELMMFFGVMFRGGYVVANKENIPGCDACLEVLFVRAFC